MRLPLDPAANRYEFRSFFSPLEQLPPAIARALADAAPRQSREIYAVSASRPGANLKYRGGELDLKRLIKADGDLEQWSPGERVGFPLARDWLTHVLAPALGLGHALAQAPPQVTAPVLFEQVLRPVSGLGIADVLKARRLFEHAGCRAEHAVVHINGAAIATVCVESTDPGAVRDALADLGLAGRENLCYPVVIARIMGLSPVPLHY